MGVGAGTNEIALNLMSAFLGEERTSAGANPMSAFDPKFDQDIRFFGCMGHQMRRIGIIPACNLGQPASLRVLV